MNNLIRITTLIVLMVGCHAMAQTNANIVARTNKPATQVIRPVSNPGLVALYAITNEISNLEKKVKALDEKHQNQKERANLEYAAGKKTGKQLYEMEKAQRAEREKILPTIGKRIGELRLQEHDIRKTYQLGKPSTSSGQSRYGN